MKLKAIKPHYYEGIFRHKGNEYFADKIHSGFCLRNGLCEDVTPKRKVQPKKKRNEGKGKK